MLWQTCELLLTNTVIKQLNKMHFNHIYCEIFIDNNNKSMYYQNYPWTEEKPYLSKQFTLTTVQFKIMTLLNFIVTTTRPFHQPLCEQSNCNDPSSYTIGEYYEEQLIIALWQSHTGVKPYSCRDCDKKSTPINVRFKGMKYKYEDCSELSISEMTQTQHLFNIFILSMNYPYVISIQLFMNSVVYGNMPFLCTLCGWDWIHIHTHQPTHQMEFRSGEFKLECVELTRDVDIIFNFLNLSHNLHVLHHLNVRY